MDARETRFFAWSITMLLLGTFVVNAFANFRLDVIIGLLREILEAVNG